MIKSVRELVQHQSKLREVINDIKVDLFKIESESIVINKDMYKILKEEIIHEVIEQVEKRVSKLSEEILQPLSKN